MKRLLCAAAALWLTVFHAAFAQDTSAPAVLVADNVYVSPERQLVAEGNVEVYQAGVRLTASRIVYDQEAGRVQIEGPIRIDDGNGAIVLASAAELDDDLQNGLLQGARLVFNDQVQLASTQMTRTGGRYSQLVKTAVTSCYVCEDGRPPLWQIRARKVIHDEEEKQLYFEDAHLRVLHVPIFYLPRLRLPDPTLERARGFLIPEIQTTSQLGTGFKIPYFFPIGDHADLTLAPYWSPKTRTLDFRYRQAFYNGAIEFEGALTRDDLIPGDTRGYLFGDGYFDLPNDYMLEFDVSASTDDAYLREYGISDADRLRREIAITRTRRDAFVGAALVDFTSLRDSEDDNTLPSPIFDIRYEQRTYPEILGGEMRYTVLGHAHGRPSSADMVGRDVARATAETMWLNSWISPFGIKTDLRAGVAVDAYYIRQDSTYPETVGVITPETALTLRRPMTKTTGNATHFIEPLMQLAWTDVSDQNVPNDESNLVEFDEGNLLSLSRFPAPDRREDGLVFAYGFNWARAPLDEGWYAHASFGQVIRQIADPDFSSGSGLAGNTSDFLVAGQVAYNKNLSLMGRTIFDEKFDFSKAELRGTWRNAFGAISTTYLWLDADPQEDRDEDSSEFWFDGYYDIGTHWTASANWRYDLADAGSTNAGIGIGYRNECVEIELTVDRNFTSSTTVEASTIFGFTISLSGFGVADGAERYASSCTHS